MTVRSGWQFDDWVVSEKKFDDFVVNGWKCDE